MTTLKIKKYFLSQKFVFISIAILFIVGSTVALQTTAQSTDDSGKPQKNVDLSITGQEATVNETVQQIITSEQGWYNAHASLQGDKCDNDQLCYLVNNYAPMQATYDGPPDVMFVEIPEKYIKHEPLDLDKVKASYCGAAASDISQALSDSVRQSKDATGPSYDTSDPNVVVPSSLDWTKTSYNYSYGHYIGRAALAIAAKCPGQTVASVVANLPKNITATVIGYTDPVCFDGSTQKPPQSVSGTYKQNTYSLSYYAKGKNLTWFGGPSDRDLLTRTGNVKASITGQNLITATGNYSAYPLARNLPANAKVTLSKQTYRGENNVATNSVLLGKCLHLCKIVSVQGQKEKKKVELWVPTIDRGPSEASIIDISPSAYRSLADQSDVKGGTSAGLSGFDVQLENCQ